VTAELNDSRKTREAPQKPRVYVAGDLITEAVRQQMQEITAELERQGFEVFLPGRDAGLLREENLHGVETRKELFKPIFERDIVEIEKADYYICILDGLCFGTSLELGYAYAVKKLLKPSLKIVGIYTDLRGTDSLDLMRTYACDMIYTSMRDLPRLIQQ